MFSRSTKPLQKAQAARPAPPAFNARKVDKPQENFSGNPSVLPIVRSRGSISIGPNGTPELIEPVSRAKPVTAPMPAKGGNSVEINDPLKSAAPIPAPGGNRMGADTPLKFDPSMVQNTTSAGLSGGNALAQATQNNSMSGFKKGGKVKPKAESTTRYASGGSVSKASGRADGIAQRGKTKGRIV